MNKNNAEKKKLLLPGGEVYFPFASIPRDYYRIKHVWIADWIGFNGICVCDYSKVYSYF